MSQRQALRDLDAAIHGAMASAGLAEDGVYRAPGVAGSDPGVPVRVYVDRDQQTLGEYGQVVALRDQVALFREDVDPVRGGTVVIDGWRYELAERIGLDDSLSTWNVRGEALP